MAGPLFSWICSDWNAAPASRFGVAGAAFILRNYFTVEIEFQPFDAVDQRVDRAELRGQGASPADIRALVGL